MEGIATVVVAWNAGVSRRIAAPRTLITKLPRGTAFGRPNDPDQQLRVLRKALEMLGQDAPIEPVYIEES